MNNPRDIEISITEAATDGQNSAYLCFRTTRPLPPDVKNFAFEVKINKWPPSGYALDVSTASIPTQSTNST